MLRDCDRLFGIGSEESRNQLLAYYPPLLDESISKKLTMMPEGISLRNECPIFVNGPLYSMLFEKDKEFYLERSFRSNPLLLTVGRLDPAKGQVKLLKAWGNSGLWNSFNLVIVGGDLDHPNRIEANELEEIRKYVRQNKELHGRFCHLPAMNNDEIRCLENSISRVKATPWPPTYVAPSFKEEFGIAILEAMAAGFVAIAPKRGGVKSYIRDGYNGFLIDTTDEASIEKELRRLLIDARPSARRMKMIAENGSKTIYRRYSISVVAKQFSSYYSS
jgi:sucrose-phosphate synthase